MKILHKHTRKVIYKNKHITNIKELVEEAVRKGVDLTGADLFNADLEGANLVGAKLSHTKLVEANLKNAYLKNADLTCADLALAYLDGANFRFAKMDHAFLYYAFGKVDFTNARMFSVQMNDVNFRNSTFQNADLNFSRLQSGIFNHSNFKNADMSKTDQTNAIMWGCNFEDADMRHSRLKYTHFSEANMKNVNFSWAFLNSTHFQNTNLENAIYDEDSQKQVICRNRDKLLDEQQEYLNKAEANHRTYVFKEQSIGNRHIQYFKGQNSRNVHWNKWLNDEFSRGEISKEQQDEITKKTSVDGIQWYLDSKNQTFGEYKKKNLSIVKKYQIITATDGVICANDKQRKDIAIFSDGTLFYNATNADSPHVKAIEKRAKEAGIEIKDFIPVTPVALEKVYSSDPRSGWLD